MIRAEIFRNSVKNITGCRITGHAEFAEHGRDVVCAAVSALSFTIAAALQQILKINLDGFSSDGEMEFSLSDEAVSDKTQLLFETMLLGLREIEVQYPDKVRIFEKRR